MLKFLTVSRAELSWAREYICDRFLGRILAKRSKGQSSADAASYESFNEYLKQNHKVWSKRSLTARGTNSNGKILIETLVFHAGYFQKNMLTGRYLMEIYGLSGVGLLLRPDRKIEKLFRSFGVNDFVYLSDRKSGFFQYAKQGYSAIRLLKNVKAPEDLFEVKQDGVNVGKIVYDTYLRMTGLGSIDRVSLLCCVYLTLTLVHHFHIKRIFKNNTIEVMVQAERQFIPSAIVCQNALIAGAKLYSWAGGPVASTVRLYESIDQIFCNTHRHSTDIYNYVYNNFRQKAAREGGNFISRRFSGDSSPNDIPDAQFAFKKDAKQITKQQLCEQLGWDSGKPIVILMANMLTDGVFTNNWSLYPDLLTWLQQTLQIIKDVDHVNWLVKSHPSDVKNKVKTTTLSQYEKYVAGCDHVQMLPNGIPPSSLVDIVDSVLTVHGSAGIEYSCYGIPCVLAGESLYSGRGFTHEPQTVKEYIDVLTTIDRLARWSDEQIERAKVMAYIYLVLSRVECNLVPVYSVFAEYDEEKLWQDSLELLQCNDPEDDKYFKMIKIQVEYGYRHLLNYDWIGLKDNLNAVSLILSGRF